MVGLGVGFGLAIDPVYISEISTAAHRGQLVTWSEIALNIGIVLGFASGLCTSMVGEDVAWRIMFAAGVIMPCFVIFFAVSEKASEEMPFSICVWMCCFCSCCCCCCFCFCLICELLTATTKPFFLCNERLLSCPKVLGGWCRKIAMRRQSLCCNRHIPRDTM